MTTPPDISAELERAQKRAGRRTLRWILIGAFIFASIVASGTWAGFRILNLTSKVADSNGKIVTLTTQVVTLQGSNHDLLTAQAENSKNERAILTQNVTLTAQVAALAKAIKDQTDPNSPAAHERNALLQNVLIQQQRAFQASFNDLLRRQGELAVALGADPAVVKRILGEPTPTPTFTAPGPVGSPIAPASSAPLTPGTSVSVCLPVICYH